MVLQKRNNPKTRQKSQLVNNFYFQTQLIKIPTYCDVAVARFHIFQIKNLQIEFFQELSTPNGGNLSGLTSRKRHREKSNVYCCSDNVKIHQIMIFSSKPTNQL